VTGGVSLGLVAAVALGSAAFKVAANAAIMGSDYSTESGIKDAITGLLEGAVALIGEGQVGALAKIGETAAMKAGTQVAKQLAEKGILKVGEEGIQKGLTTTVREAILHGGREVPEKALNTLAKQFAKEGATEADIALVKQTLKDSLAESLKRESTTFLQKAANWSKDFVRDVSLNAG